MTELGTRLKEAREEKDLSLDDLQQITKIQKRYLIGIEEGNYNVMPGKFYVRAFIKQYAEAVGIEPEILFEEYKAEIPGTYSEELPEQISRARTRKQISPGNSKILDMVPKILTAVFIIGFFIAIYWFFQNRDVVEDPNKDVESEETQYDESTEPPPSSDEKNDEENGEGETPADVQDDPTVEEDEVIEEKPIQELVQTEKGTSTATYELKNIDTFNVEVTAKPGGETWVDIQNTKGHKFFYGMMKDGQKEQIDLSNETEITFNIGRTSDTEMKINGEVFQYPFTDVVAQKIKIIFTPTTTE